MKGKAGMTIREMRSVNKFVDDASEKKNAIQLAWESSNTLAVQGPSQVGVASPVPPRRKERKKNSGVREWWPWQHGWVRLM